MQNPFEQQLLRFNRIAGQSLVMLAAVPTLWSFLWLTLGIRYGYFPGNSNWDSNILSPAKSLWIAIPVAAFLILAYDKSTLRVWNGCTIICYSSVAVAVLLLSSWNGLFTCALVVGTFHIVAVLQTGNGLLDSQRQQIDLLDGATNTPDLESNAEPSNSVATSTPTETDSARNSGSLSSSFSDPADETNNILVPTPDSMQQSFDDEGEVREEDVKEEDNEDQSQDADWVQQLTWRKLNATENNRFELEWFARHHWQSGQSTVEFHVLFQPAFIQFLAIE